MIKLIQIWNKRILRRLVNARIKEIAQEQGAPTSYLLINCTMGKPGYTISSTKWSKVNITRIVLIRCTETDYNIITLILLSKNCNLNLMIRKLQTNPNWDILQDNWPVPLKNMIQSKKTNIEELFHIEKDYRDTTKWWSRLVSGRKCLTIKSIEKLFEIWMWTEGKR